jgi:hypothetical protein
MHWDDVRDWLDRLEREGDELVDSTLRAIVDAPPDEPIVDGGCTEAIAAAEAVACCAGAAPDEVPEPLRAHVERCGVPDEERIGLAFGAVERIRLQRDDHEEWLLDLEQRLGVLLGS